MLAVLALCLRLSDRSELLPVIKNNAFLMRVIDAAAKELWKSSHPSIWSLPDCPDYFVERHFFKDLKDKLSQVSLVFERVTWVTNLVESNYGFNLQPLTRTFMKLVM